ncbi:unnamed protein product [Dracunculus medinensis]|uniref:N-acetyltransferase domain-containing protein n=1 Tax=Dracunculus medinensis TaxID=318479 RepID=A0A0N4UM53_DRAME|nr:unnamed protein product [Dracunculus medinensis]
MEEKNFGDFTIIKVTEKDIDDILKFLYNDFLHEEPISSSINITESEADKLYRDFVSMGAKSSLSYMLKDHDGHIVGLRLASIIDRDGKQDGNEPIKIDINKDPYQYTGESNQFSVKANHLKKILDELDDKIWITLNPRITRLFNLIILSVDKYHRRQGLAEKLVNYNLEEIQQRGCQGIVVEATAIKSQEVPSFLL